MNAAALLDHLVSVGLHLAPAGDGRIVVKPVSRLSDTDRAAILANKPELLELLAVERKVAGPAAVRPPVMTKAQADTCHSPSWSDAETDAFMARRDRLMRWGRAESEAEAIAERLTLRDREADDRHMCSECRFGQMRFCPDGSPMPAEVLHRCPSMNPAAEAPSAEPPVPRRPTAA